MKNIYKTAWAIGLFFAMGLFASACGEAPQTEDKTQKESTEAPADTAGVDDEHPSEHPTDGEHPSEHPGDSDEHPAENEHPN